jgi:hypothetical protein
VIAKHTLDNQRHNADITRKRFNAGLDVSSLDAGSFHGGSFRAGARHAGAAQGRVVQVGRRGAP